jgi:hypothetical protein
METENLAIITSSKLYIDKQLTKADPNGLLSEQIFGPLVSYKCQCGNYNSKILYENQICPTCNVKCISSESRYHTWAKIKLLFPIVKKRKIDVLLKILKKHYKYLLDPLQADLTITSHIYIKYDKYIDQISIEKQFSEDCLPLAVTGIYSLYLSFYIIHKYYQSAVAKDLLECFMDEVLVLPPNCRLSLVTDDKGNKKIFKSELDDLYSDLINIQIYNERQYQSYVNHNQYYNMVVISLDNNLNTPIIDDQIRILDSISSYFQFYCNKIYEKVSDILSGKTGLIRRDFLGKYLDFSSRAVVTVDPALDAYQIRLAKKSFVKLWYLEYLRYLKIVHNYSLDKLKGLIKKSEVEDSIYSEHIDEFIEYYIHSADVKNKLILLNRVPSLWRHSIPIVEVVGINENDIITVSPMIIEQMNMDFDGDTSSVFKLHDVNVQTELYENAFQLNIIKYDHNDQYLAQIKNEAVYAFNLLVLTEPDKNIIPLIINNLKDLSFDYDIILSLDQPVQFKNKIYSYGICLLNKWLLNDDILITAKNNPQDISNIIYINSKDNYEYHHNLSEFNRKLNWFLSSHRTKTLTFELEESCSLLEQCTKNPLLKELPNNPYIGSHIFEAISDSVINSIPKDYNLIKLLKAKFKKGQFLRSLVSCGYVANDRNEVHYKPINATLLGGLSEEDFFTCSIGTRKGLTDKQNLTPKSGYLCRSLIMNLSPIEIIESDCGTSIGINIIIQNKSHAKSLVNRYYKINNSDGWSLTSLEFLNSNIGKTIILRSPITCQSPNYKLCEKCFGKYDILNKKYVGIHCGQVVSERLTQLSMRSFTYICTVNCTCGDC